MTTSNAAHYLHHSDADRFFIELAQELECFPPLVFNDPFGYLLKQFESILDFPASENIEIDILTSTRLNLKRAQQLEIDSQKPNFDGLFMEGKYEESVKLAEGIHLEEEEKVSIAWSLAMIGDKLSTQGWEQKNSALIHQAIENYKKALAIMPDSNTILCNWGLALVRLAEQENDSNIFVQAIEKYKEALSIDPTDSVIICNYAMCISKFAKFKKDPKMFLESCELYKAALEINPSYHGAFDNWGAALLFLSNLRHEPELLEEAKSKLLQAKSLSDKPSYNLACLYALQNEKDFCKQELLDCLDANVLPAKDTIESDSDFNSVREDEWFQEFSKKLNK